jgi:hypothetical protein
MYSLSIIYLYGLAFQAFAEEVRHASETVAKNRAEEEMLHWEMAAGAIVAFLLIYVLIRHRLFSRMKNQWQAETTASLQKLREERTRILTAPNPTGLEGGASPSHPDEDAVASQTVFVAPEKADDKTDHFVVDFAVNAPDFPAVSEVSHPAFDQAMLLDKTVTLSQSPSLSTGGPDQIVLEGLEFDQPTQPFSARAGGQNHVTPLGFVVPPRALSVSASGASRSSSSVGIGDWTPSIYLLQDFSRDPVGQMPKGWTGENNTYAALEVISDPDNTSRKCMLFKKTSGDGPTGFACTFPDVWGKLNVEFDFRCDNKNKQLLGLYLEKDGDFRRSIHTVIQSAGSDQPSFLRLFTRPTAYQLRTWRHIRYVVDLPAGVVDGYVDGQLVAEGIPMGIRTDSLNTLSIRDSSETVGSLYVANLVISASGNR